MSLYALALEATVLLGIWLTLAVAQLDPSSPGRRNYLALTLAAVAWCLGDLLLVRGIVDEIFADRLKYLGSLALPALWLGVAASAARLEVARRVPWFPLILLAPSACLYALLYSERWGPLFMTTVVGGDDIHGPLWRLGTLYGYALVMAGSIVMLTTAFRWKRPGDWMRRIALGLAPLLPLAGNAAYLSGAHRWEHDPAPVFLGVALLALRSGAFSGGLLQALSISQQELLQQLPFGVLLTDRRSTVLHANIAAGRALGAPKEAIVGRSLVAVLDGASDEVCVDVAPVFAGSREVGQLVILGSAWTKSFDGPTPRGGG